MRGQVDPLRRLEARRRAFGAPRPGQVIGYRKDGRPVRLQAGGSGITVVQHASTTQAFTSGTSGTVSPAFGSATTPGTTLVACIGIENDIGVTTVSSVTTNGAAENWAQAVTDAAGVAFGWWDGNTGGGQTVIDVTVTFGGTSTASDSTVVTVDIYEVSGLGSAPAIDKTASADSSGTSWSSGNITTTQASEIAFGLNMGQGTVSFTLTGPAAPWVNEAQLSITQQAGGSATPDASVSGYDILTSAGTISYAGTASSSALAFTVIFSIAPGGSFSTAAPPAPPLIPPGRMSPMAFGFRPNAAPAPHADTDTGTGTDTATVQASLSGSDTGAGLDSASVTEGASDSDSGTGADLAVTSATVPGSDAGTGADAGTITASTSSGDTGAGAEAGSVVVLIPVGSPDTGTAAETESVAVRPVVLWKAPDKLSKTGGVMS